MFKDLLDKARQVAEQTLPADVVDAGKKFGRSVAAHAPAPLAEVIEYVTREQEQPGRDDEAEAATEEPTPREPAEPVEPVAEQIESPEAEAEPTTADASGPSPTEAAPAEPKPKVGREDPKAVLQRVKTKADSGLKPEDRLVVVYWIPEQDPQQDEDVKAILATLESVEAEVRENDLRREPQTARQLSKLTGVMVPPYVFINGKHWGARYEVEALAASGDLDLVVANRLDEVSEETRRMGDIRDSYSDEISVDNILTRWKLGHILCVDDLDSWYETERDGSERFYYGGGPRPVEDMRAVAEEIAAAVEADEYEATWMLEPSVHLP